MLLMVWPRVLSAATARDKYYKAEACFKRLRHNPKKQKYRDKWLGCIKKFEAVYRHDPKGPWAAAGLYMTGQLYQELYKRSFKRSDKETAIDIYERIITDFPKSKYKQKAKYVLRRISYKKTLKRASKREMPKKNMAMVPEDDVEAEIEKLTSTPLPVKKDLKGSIVREANVLGLRYWSNPSYTRVVVDADNDVSYTHRLLKKDVSAKKPQRLYVDLNNSRLKKDVKKIVPINDDLLIDARAGQYTANKVRVVVDIKSFQKYKIFSLKNPFRIVIDVWGTVDEQAQPMIKTVKKNTRICLLYTSDAADE